MNGAGGAGGGMVHFHPRVTSPGTGKHVPEYE